MIQEIRSDFDEVMNDGFAAELVFFPNAQSEIRIRAMVADSTFETNLESAGTRATQSKTATLKTADFPALPSVGQRIRYGETYFRISAVRGDLNHPLFEIDFEEIRNR